MNKTSYLLSVIVLILQLSLFSCGQEHGVESNLADENLIPYPVSLKATHIAYDLSKDRKIYIDGENAELNSLAKYLSESIKFATGLQFEIVNSLKLNDNGIQLSLVALDSIRNKEAYFLQIQQEYVKLQANSEEGIFRGIQTLLQVIPAASISDSTQLNHYYLPSGEIVDFPRFEHRGIMLDVVRHFFEVKDVKRLIDLMSLYKMNKLHLHLADDQGWRIEIKSWPNLAIYGGSTEVGGSKGGFYTQTEFKEIVEYAVSKYITIIPEIDMPGHTNAALASYAELNCDKKARNLYTGTKVGFSSLCVRDELTYTFIDDVIRELAEISPSKYIHIGGDESHSTTHKDYIYFIDRVLGIVEKHGKHIIGWDEISHAAIDSNTVAQYWANKKNAQLAVKKGAKVIFSPASLAYLDMKYHKNTKLGLKWAGVIEVDKAYNWLPDTLVDGILEENILGIEAPLWTETVENVEDMDFMLFPRLLGYAEIAWSPAETIKWNNYKLRLAKHGKRLDELDVNFYKSELVDWK